MKTSSNDNSDIALECYLEDEVVQEVLKTGTDLREYSEQIEKQLKDVENTSIQDYIKESQNIVSLHNQIAACDNILERMESMLMNFKSDLGSISSEIVYLQRKSIVMSQQLHNRQAVRGQLSQFIDDIALPVALINGILEAPVTDKEFLIQLTSLNHKISFFKEQIVNDVKCCQDVREQLENLKVKAVTKIRAYLLEQISKFRKPMANYQVTQNAILKYKFFFEFALANERAVAQEIRKDYVTTMSKVYFSYFKWYSSLLSKLVYESDATKDDLMGIEETGFRSLFQKSSLKQKNTVFTIGNRAEVLTSQFEAPIIIPHSAQKADQRFPYEALFRSEQYALVDNACREFLFISEFFKLNDGPARELFSQIMGKTTKLLIKNLDTYVNTSFDSISLFLCIQLVLRYQMLCHKRVNPALDDYWDMIQEIIWPRFEHVLHLNIQSIKDCDATKFGQEMKPHYISRKYAEFSSVIISINESFPIYEMKVNNLLNQLLIEVQMFMLRMTTVFNLRAHQLVFLINNYDMILGILRQRMRENCKEVDSFKELLQKYRDEYVEEALSPHFGGIIEFVKEMELYQDNPDHLKKSEGKSLVLVQTFKDTWKRSLDTLKNDIILSFPSLVTGSSLVQLALGHLLQYYERFHKLLTPNVRSQLVNIHVIKVEIRKYKTNFS